MKNSEVMVLVEQKSKIEKKLKREHLDIVELPKEDINIGPRRSTRLKK